MTLKGDPGAFASFIEYMEEHAGAKSECDGPPQKMQRSDTNGEDMCKICFTRPIDCVLVPCGHFFARMICAERLADEPCPICIQGVAFAQKTYRA